MRPAVVALAIIALALCLPVEATGAGAYSVTEYALPASATGIGAMAIDGGGNVWLLQSGPPVLYKLVAANGTFSNYSLSGFAGAGFTGLSVDDEGVAWFADPKGNRFGSYGEATNATAELGFPGPIIPGSVLRRGRLVWLGCREEIGEYDLPTGSWADHFVSRSSSYILDLHFDRTGNVWFVENGRDKVGVYFVNYGRISEFDIPWNDSAPTCLAIDGQGRLWFVEDGRNRLGAFDTELFGFAGEYGAPTIDGLEAVLSHVAAVNDSVWLTDVKYGRVLRLENDSYAAASLGKGTAPTFIEADANGSLWVYEAGMQRLARLDVTEQFGQATPTPTLSPTPTAMPSATATARPTPAPGLMALVSIVGLIAALRLKTLRK